MAATKTFHLGDILTITDGHLVSPRHIEGVYDILNWMTGDNLFTHQLPRACRECRDPLLAQFPDLAEVVFPAHLAGAGDKAAIEAWLAEQVARYGETREVAPLAAGQHTQINPLAELAMIRPDMPVVVIDVDGDGDRS